MKDKVFEALGLEDLEHIAGGVPIDMIHKMAPDMIPELAPELASKLDAILAQAQSKGIPKSELTDRISEVLDKDILAAVVAYVDKVWW